MVELTKKELVSINVDILREIHSFCKENKIVYSLYYGTLIGAVRHKGFIPWDDDVDIVMPRPCYERFIRTYKSTGKYKLFACEIDNSYILPIGRLADTTTLKIEESSSGYNIGIAVDIFPVDGLPENNNFMHRFKLMFWRNAFRFKGTILFKKGRLWYKSLFVGMIKIVLSPFPLSFICRTLNNVAKEYPFDSSINVCSYLSPYREKDITEKTTFDSIIAVEFEGSSFNAVADYDKCLRKLYGDYMQLPPIDKRVSDHDAKFFKLI